MRYVTAEPYRVLCQCAAYRVSLPRRDRVVSSMSYRSCLCESFDFPDQTRTFDIRYDLLWFTTRRGSLRMFGLPLGL
jgi:hypothetical protein